MMPPQLAIALGAFFLLCCTVVGLILRSVITRRRSPAKRRRPAVARWAPFANGHPHPLHHPMVWIEGATLEDILPALPAD